MKITGYNLEIHNSDHGNTCKGVIRVNPDNLLENGFTIDVQRTPYQDDWHDEQWHDLTWKTGQPGRDDECFLDNNTGGMLHSWLTTKWTEPFDLITKALKEHGLSDCADCAKRRTWFAQVTNGKVTCLIAESRVLIGKLVCIRP